MTQILPTFGNVGLTVLALIVALSIIVAVHEYGHYIVGRWSGIHAETFSLGFGPVIWSGVDRRGTKWQISALPLGGYVKFLGDANAASVGGTGGARNTMLGAPLWARAATVAAGPVFNFILSLVVFAGLAMWYGKVTDKMVISSIPAFPDSFVQELQPGDEVIGIDGQRFATTGELNAIVDTLSSQPAVDYLVIRDGGETTVRGPYPAPALVRGVNPRTAASAAGLVEGDVVLTMNGSPVYAFSDMIKVVAASDGAEIPMTVWRNGTIRDFAITPRPTAVQQDDGGLAEELKLGIGGGNLFFDVEIQPVGPFEALWSGAKSVWYVISSSLTGIYSILAGKISPSNVNGPIAMAQISGQMATTGLADFIGWVAILSTAVGLLNLFPIPVLDGGHLVFHAYEAVTGRQPSDGALRVLMAIGLGLIGTLMIFALSNDLWYFFKY